MHKRPAMPTASCPCGSRLQAATVSPTKACSHSRNLRKGRFSETGRIYLITSTTYKRYKRHPIFLDYALGREMVKSMRHKDLNLQTETLAFAIMPGHFHWLITLKNNATLDTVMRSLKAYSARHVNALRQSREPVWQAGYHDHALRKEENLPETARYVVMNPVRVGLVKSPGDYPLGDAAWL